MCIRDREETATAESRTETMEGKKQEETIQNMEQENAAFLNSKKEEQKETTAAGPVQILSLIHIFSVTAPTVNKAFAARDEEPILKLSLIHI